LLWLFVFDGVIKGVWTKGRWSLRGLCSSTMLWLCGSIWPG